MQGDGGDGSPAPGGRGPLEALFADLESQADGLARAWRDAEVAGLAADAYAEVDLAGRLHASRGDPVRLSVLGAGSVAGRLVRAGRGWCLVDRASPGVGSRGGPALVVLAAVTAVSGLSRRAVPAEARPVTARLGLGSGLRTLREETETQLVVLVTGERHRGRILRVGADFLELTAEEDGGGTLLVPWSALACVLGC